MREVSWSKESERTFSWTDAFQGENTFVRVGPDPHLSIAVFALLSQFRPRLGFGQQFAHCALRQTENVSSEYTLADAVLRKKLSHSGRDQDGIQWFE